MPEVPDEVVDRIMQSLENECYDWRTIQGVAREAQTTEEIVRYVFRQRADEIVESSVPSQRGDDLFTTRRRYGQHGKTVGRLFGAFKGRAR